MPAPRGGFREGTTAARVLAELATRGVTVVRYTPSGDGAYIDCGPHDVRAYARGHGCTLEFRTAAVGTLDGASADPRRSRRIEIRQTPRGLYTGRVTPFNIAATVDLLRRLTRMPASPIRLSTRSARPERRFGVEIEFFGSRFAILEALRAAGIPTRQGMGHGVNTWTLKSDSSLRGGPRNKSGLELASPPLLGEDGLEQVRAVLRVLCSAGAVVNSSCGLHVHHEARGLGALGIARLVRLWYENQDLIDWFIQPDRRGGRNTYCRRWSETEIARLEARAQHGIRAANHERFHTVNVTSYPAYGTLECRQHGGTLEYRKVEAWIRFGQAMMNAAAASPNAAETASGGLIGLLQEIGLDGDSMSFLVGRAVTFGVPSHMIGAPLVQAEAA